MRAGFLPALMIASLLASPAWALKTLVIINNSDTTNQTERLVSSSPYDGQALNVPPSSVTLTFSQPVRPGDSSIRVFDMYGYPRGDDAISASGSSLSINLPALPPGRYTVKWRAECACDGTETLEGRFHFTVK